MKVAVTSNGKNLNSNSSLLFGRNPYFIVVNLENGVIKYVLSIENHEKNEKGAGNVAAQFMVDSNVKAVIGGKLGPIAFHLLRNAGIKVYKISSLNVEKNLKRFNEDKLDKITSLGSGYPI
ncbi:MAG: NifB/NifX family molybdenum-iron cluster-binding protein [Methanobacterium sp.]